MMRRMGLDGGGAFEIPEAGAGPEEFGFEGAAAVFLEELIFGFGDGECFEEADGEGAHDGGFELGEAPLGSVDKVEVRYGSFGVPLVEAILNDVAGSEVFFCAHDAEGGSGEDFEAAFFCGVKDADEFEALGFEYFGGS